jgi:hypothetical protein
MAELFLKRTLRGFEPADEPSLELSRKYRTGEIYRAKIVKPRSWHHHKLCMALLRLTYQNQERWSDFTLFRKAVAMAAGHTEELITVHGEVIRIPGSLSFEALDEVEFTKVFAGMMSVCADILGVTRPDLQMEVDRYAAEIAA